MAAKTLDRLNAKSKKKMTTVVEMNVPCCDDLATLGLAITMTTTVTVSVFRCLCFQVLL